jgi:SAM-dependent methyltransferase
MDVDVEKFCERAGIVRHRGAMEFWNALEASTDRTVASDVEGVLTRRRHGVSADADIDLLFGSLERLRLTLDAVAPHVIPWLNALDVVAPDDTEILDLGCGGGVVACFLAMGRPDRVVVGVDRSDACLHTARSLAAALGLANVTFVHGDIETFDFGRRFGAVVSSAVWAETLGTNQVAPWFSTINALPVRLGDGSDPLSRCVDRHLADHGVYVSLERCRDVSTLASWIGSLQSSGMIPDLGASTMLDTDGVLTGLERLPLIVARRTGEKVSPGRLLDWRLSHGNPETEREIETELHVAGEGPWIVMAGEMMEVDDGSGAMSAALCLMEHETVGILYFTTTRGVREVLAHTTEGGAAQFVPMYRSVRNSVGRRPSVRSRRPIEDEDAAVVVPRLTFSWER